MTNHSPLHQELLDKIQNQKAVVGIVGLGYVGLPLALAFAEKNFKVVGFDVDDNKVSRLNRGENFIAHIGSDRVKTAVENNLFSATADFTELKNVDAILIAVPTPLTKQREPDMRYIIATTEVIRDNLKKGHLVVLESTTYPGTTDELMKDMLEQTGLKSGTDFFLAYSPEREDPGNKHFETRTIPKVVGGVDPVSGSLAVALYESSIAEVVEVKSARAAEATKLTENIFRAVNIALVNELKVVFDKMDIDVWDVIDAAATKPFGYMKFTPGPGLGGHCIPLDPFYLTWKAREYGLATRFIELAGEVNVSMPGYVIDKLSLALNDRKKPLKGAKVLLMGLAYKKDIDDPRESPSFELLELLLERGAEVTYHDPHVAKMPSMRSWPHLPKLESVPFNEATVKAADVVLISTAHTAVDYDLLLKNAQLVIDTRGVYRGENANVVKA